jgi:hypothetical protein
MPNFAEEIKAKGFPMHIINLKFKAKWKKQ